MQVKLDFKKGEKGMLTSDFVWTNNYEIRVNQRKNQWIYQLHRFKIYNYETNDYDS